MSFFPRFWKWLRFADKQGALKVTFSFFLSKKSHFSALVCEGCESKKVQTPGNAPACHVRARKGDFFEGKIISSSSVFHWGKKWLQISLPSLEYFKPQNHDDCFLWNNMIKSNVFMMIVFFVWFCNVWVSYLMLLVVDTSLFRRFFTLYPHFHPYIYEGVKEESCTLRESAVEYLCEEHEWVPKIGLKMGAIQRKSLPLHQIVKW